jgi:two-component system NtrC family sensor kinase
MPEKPRLLVVDDREENRYVLCRVLQRAGYDCEQADTGRAALEKARSQPSVVILDVHLPDMSGYEVCRRIKKDPETAQVSVLQISASFVSNEDRARALEAGADSYLTHPIDGIVLVATVRSLLRLRQAEVQARESSAQWQSTFDALSEGLAFVNAEGRLARFNHAFAQIAGLQCSDVGVQASELLHRLQGSSEALRYTGSERYTSEFAIGAKTIEMSVDRVTAEGGEIGKILVLKDITDRKLAEYALRTAEKLAATGKLANAIAHEINNPLEALINLIYLGRSSESIPEVQQYLSAAQEEIERIGRITKQSLSFHRDTRYAVPVDVGSLVKEVVDIYGNVAAARRVELVCDQRPSFSIYGFPGQLRQVFANLVRNAAEAAPANSQVIVRVRPAHQADRHGTRVTIHDRGSGIPKSVQRQMFDPFFTTKELKGSGLGLWVSKAVVIRHRGRIRFRSRTRNGSSGTTFEVFLPVGGLDASAVDAPVE